MSIESNLSGFLFLLILILNIFMSALGNKTDIGEIDAGTKLNNIINNPNKFKISIALGLVENICIIFLALLLYIVFNQYNVILGIIWVIFRTGEGLIFVYNEYLYWGLLKLSMNYKISNESEKMSLKDSAHTVLKKRKMRYSFAILLFSIGTLAYSILFVTYSAVPSFIGWLGIITGISLGLGETSKLLKPNIGDWVALGGLVAILFEFCIGIWLLIN